MKTYRLLVAIVYKNLDFSIIMQFSLTFCLTNTPLRNSQYINSYKWLKLKDI